MKLITVKLPVLNVKAKGTNVILTQNITKRKELPIDPALFSYCPLCLLEMYRCRYTANHIAVFTRIHIHGKHKPEKDKAPPGKRPMTTTEINVMKISSRFQSSRIN
jgi:hypothetical protein